MFAPNILRKIWKLKADRLSYFHVIIFIIIIQCEETRNLPTYGYNRYIILISPLW
jgi:hypothetical protein